jgi:transposase
LTIAADANERRVVFVAQGRDAKTLTRLPNTATHKAQPEQITSVSIDMSPAFMRGVADHLLKDPHRLSAAGRADLDALVGQCATKHITRAWLIANNCAQSSTASRSTSFPPCPSSGVPMSAAGVCQRDTSHFDGIIAWTQTRQTNGFVEALKGLRQAAKRKARVLYSLRHHAYRAVPHRQ